MTLRRSFAIWQGLADHRGGAQAVSCGRATHGVLDGVLALMREHGFVADEVELIE